MGEPRWIWGRVPHPVVLMGRALSALETRLNAGAARRAKGIAVLLVLAIGAIIIGAALTALGGLVTVCAAAVLLSHRSLVDHVAAVADALWLSVGDGRASVAMIVGRDTANMARADVARAAIESAAENFSDGVIAPAFWFAVAGLPGLMLYKVVNTADSMIGHRTPRYAAFGWAAARADDALNLLPARITAALFWVLTRPRPSWAAIQRDARLHRSPNAGWPEAAMARAVDVALAGPRSYHGQIEDHPFVHPTGTRNIGPEQIRAALRLLWQAWGAMLAIACLVALI